MQRFLLVIIVSSFIIGFSGMVEAVGVMVKPKEINLTAAVGEKIKTEFLVINVATESALYQVKVDNQWPKIKLSPKEFLLFSGQSQIVKVSTRFFWPKNYLGEISVVARPPGASGLVTATGIKLPIAIKIYGLPWFLITGGIAFVCSLVFFVISLRKKRKLKSTIL
ncbi:MAG TPA: hypothetical protein VJG65_03425 [Patescibacteria group bacterium]|nr:hypothetical protein [Patescibacteria group bacterium]